MNYPVGMSVDPISSVPDLPGWSYGAFARDEPRGNIRVPLVREDGKTVSFTVPDFVNDPADLGRIAAVVAGAVEKWERVEGLGA
jgi:hypothetical protein